MSSTETMRIFTYPTLVRQGSSPVFMTGRSPNRNTFSVSSSRRRNPVPLYPKPNRMFDRLVEDTERFLQAATSIRLLLRVPHPYATTCSLPSPARIPSETWDSHMHVIVPAKFPVVADAQYQPSTHTISEAIAFEGRLGINNMVLVQPSCYGTDNSCLLDALKQLGPTRGRGVVAIDPWSTSSEKLAEWHEMGVRGIRINLKSVEERLSKEQLENDLERYAELLRPLGWVIQLYLPMDMISLLEDIVPRLRVKVCIDHFGSPPSNDSTNRVHDPRNLAGFNSLLNLLKNSTTWVKISAPYRLSNDAELRDLEAIFHQLATVAPKKLLYATDWPHTRFQNVDAQPFAQQCLQWATQHNIVDSLFRDAAKELWSV